MSCVFAKFLVFLSCFLSTNLYAFVCCDNCEKFCVETEWLYFRPIVDTALIDVQIQTNTSTTSRGFINQLNHSSGWRIGGCFPPCYFLDNLCIRWTQFKENHSGNVAGFSGTVPGTIIFPNGIGFDNLRFKYHAFEGLFSKNLCCCGCFDFNLLGGAQYAFARILENAQFILALGTNVTAVQRSSFWGVGPELGFDSQLHLWKCFSLTAKGLGSLLISRTHHRERTGNVLNDIDPQWRVVPAFDARVGLKLDLPLSCVRFFVEGGYEVIAYINALPVINVIALVLAFSTPYSDVVMHGPYVAGGIRF